MKFNETRIKGLYIANIQPSIDERGFFVRSYCNKELEKIGVIKSIKQINHSSTSKIGSIRGMHYQNPPYSEIKMIRCIYGEVFDVVIDIRENSETFLQWHGEYLSSENYKMMIVPEGFAHGFQVIKENSQLLYLHTESYTPESESGILFNDKAVKIKWPLQVTDISNRDLKHNVVTKNFKGINIK